MEIDYKQYINEVEGFPKVGVNFKDITPILSNPDVFKSVIFKLSDLVLSSFQNVHLIAAIEARGFFFGSPIATLNSFGLIPIRKEGKLPHPKVATYSIKEYGTDMLEVKENEEEKKNIVIVDDVLATGGTLIASEHLLNAAGYNVIGAVTLIDLTFLHKEIKVGGNDVLSLIKY